MSGAACLADVFRYVLVLVFALSAAGKLRRFRFFNQTLTDFAPIPAPVAPAAAIAVVLAEVAVCLGLVASDTKSRQVALGGALVMLVVFTGVLAVALASGSAASCSCFGASRHEISGYDLGRNLALVGASAFAFMHDGAGGGDPLRAALLGGVAAILAVLLLHLGTVGALIAPPSPD
ncbi:MAG: hypothetical protein JO157_16135 [Acetobacteraceae bacterium]|nr:hypothetical protein [Acetobacteraceae bacterium]